MYNESGNQKLDASSVKGFIYFLHEEQLSGYLSLSGATGIQSLRICSEGLGLLQLC